MRDFVAIDFETANPKRVSACALGFAIVRDGQITESAGVLIKPIGGHAPFQTRIHGLTEADTADQSTFGQLFPSICKPALVCDRVDDAFLWRGNHRGCRLTNSRGRERQTHRASPASSDPNSHATTGRFRLRLSHSGRNQTMSYKPTHQALKHRGYVGSIEHDLDTGGLYGRVMGIADVLHYEGTTIPELVESFCGTVDDYLDFCDGRGEQPDAPASGEFRLRLDPALHSRLKAIAAAQGDSLNDVVTRALEQLAG